MPGRRVYFPFDGEFLEQGGELEYGAAEYRKSTTIAISTLTIEDFLAAYELDMADVALIKMDIEGSESIVVPALEELLRRHRPPLILSLHWVFLKSRRIERILQMLASI